MYQKSSHQKRQSVILQKKKKFKMKMTKREIGARS